MPIEPQSPLQIQYQSSIYMNSTHLSDTSLQQHHLHFSTIHSPLPPRSLVHIVAVAETEQAETNELESTDDDIVFIEAIAATARPALERCREGRGRPLRPRVVSTNEDDEFFVEKVVGWKVERGREFFLNKWAGFTEEFNTWENGAEKRLEIPEIVEEYFTELGVDDEVSNYDDINNYIIKEKGDVYCKYFIFYFYLINSFSFLIIKSLFFFFIIF
jgi:hypothetical protein